MLRQPGLVSTTMTKDKKKSLYVNGRASNRQVKLLVDSGAVVSVHNA